MDKRTNFQYFVEEADFSRLFEEPRQEELWKSEVDATLELLVSLWLVEEAPEEAVLALAYDLSSRGLFRNKNSQEVWEILELFSTHRTLKVMARDLEGGFVRLNQFVKTFSPASTSQMLVDFFIRGAGIYCKEQQTVADLVISVSFPSTERNLRVETETTTAIIVQVKLQKNAISRRVKQAWLSTVDSLGCLPSGGSRPPFVAIFLEFGDFEEYAESAHGHVFMQPAFGQTREPSTSGRPSEPASKKRRGEVQAPTRGSNAVGKDGSIRGFGIFTKRLLLGDILPIDHITSETNKLMKKLLVSVFDPAHARAIGNSDRTLIKDMFKTLVYYLSDQ